MLITKYGYLFISNDSTMEKYLLVLVFASFSAFGQQADLARQAELFISSLSPDLKTKAVYGFDDSERFNWHFVPKSRNGVSLRELNENQRTSALNLLKASLSTQGFEKATAIVALETVLKEVEHRGAGDDYRDPLNYYLTIFGKPGGKVTWGWRFEGHHVALNFSSVNNRIEASTPSFFGSNPAVVLEGSEKGKQVLKKETELAFDLINSLNTDQKKLAIISQTALQEIVSFNSRKAVTLSPEGIPFGKLAETQKQNFLALLDIYVSNYEFAFASTFMAKIKKAGLDNLSFAWAGSLTPGSPYYYRIQGPMLLIELDNTQNGANHIHSVVRDLTNDFGDDILREHYQKEHHGK